MPRTKSTLGGGLSPITFLLPRDLHKWIEKQARIEAVEAKEKQRSLLQKMADQGKPKTEIRKATRKIQPNKSAVIIAALYKEFNKAQKAKEKAA